MSAEAAFLRQARICSHMGSPFTARLLRLVAPRLARGGPVMDRIADWPGEIGPSGDAVALRLAGGLHNLVITGADTTLAAAYPPHTVEDAALAAALDAALARHAAFLTGWLASPPQTNELRRSAVAIAAAHWLSARFGMPLDWLEIGASAGLNLAFDAYGLEAAGHRLGPAAPVVALHPDWRGAPPPASDPTIAARAGCDIAPLDARQPGDRLRLLSYIWPDQAERLANTATALAHVAARDIRVARSDAAAWLETRLSQPAPGRVRVIFHSVAWQYFPETTASRARAAIEAAGARATAQAPLAWLAMEADGSAPGAGLRLQLWPGGAALDFGRADFHARWVDWHAPIP